jgi:hypothetical protein
MKDNQSENERLESLLRSVHLPDPSPRLKERITAEAARMWNQSSLELSWSIPLRRLAASAAAAVVIVWLANYSSDRALGRWRSAKVPVVVEQPADIDVLPELPYGPLARRLVSINRGALPIGTLSLSDRAETIRQVLDEARQSGASSPAGGSSGLVPDQAAAN